MCHHFVMFIIVDAYDNQILFRKLFRKLTVLTSVDYFNFYTLRPHGSLFGLAEFLGQRSRIFSSMFQTFLYCQGILLCKAEMHYLISCEVAR